MNRWKEMDEQMERDGRTEGEKRMMNRWREIVQQMESDG